MTEKSIVVSGKRKTAIAKATIKEGNGKITINKKGLFYFPPLNRMEVEEPLLIADEVLGKRDYDIEVNVKGGGIASQTEATRLAVARAIIKFTKNESLKRAYLNYDRNLLVADTRRKETYKPRDSKARARRQKSYR
ncbi:MAG: 30S ribosomal protein S9 [Candidatus Pacearchaeota archaeon]